MPASRRPLQLRLERQPGPTEPPNLTPGLDRLQLGQRIMTFFELAEFEPDVHITAVLDRFNALFGDLAITLWGAQTRTWPVSWEFALNQVVGSMTPLEPEAVLRAIETRLRPGVPLDRPVRPARPRRSCQGSGDP